MEPQYSKIKQDKESFQEELIPDPQQTFGPQEFLQSSRVELITQPRRLSSVYSTTSPLDINIHTTGRCFDPDPGYQLTSRHF